MHLILGIACFLTSILIAVLVVFLTWTLFSRFGTARGADIASDNRAAAIVLAGELLAFGLLMSKAVYPASALLQNLFLGFGGNPDWLRTLGYVAGHFLVGYVLSLLTIALSAWLFRLLTPTLDERAEVKKGNVAVALAFAGVVVAVAMIVQHGLGDLLNTLIPPPAADLIQTNPQIR